MFLAPYYSLSILTSKEATIQGLALPISSLRPGVPRRGLADVLPLKGIYFAVQREVNIPQNEWLRKFPLKLETLPNIIPQESI